MYLLTICTLTWQVYIVEYKHILAALIDSEQMLFSIEAQLCTRKECKTFRPRRPSSVAMHKVRVRHCPTYIVNILRLSVEPPGTLLGLKMNTYWFQNKCCSALKHSCAHVLSAKRFDHEGLLQLQCTKCV